MRTFGIILLGDSRLPAQRLRDLQDALPTSDDSPRLLVAGGDSLDLNATDAYLRDAGARDALRVVHVVSDPSSPFSERVEHVARQVSQHYPAATHVTTWVVTQAGRAIGDDHRERMQQLTASADDLRLAGVLVVAGSTSEMLAPRATDVAGMVADVSFSLATSALSERLVQAEGAKVWLCASRGLLLDPAVLAHELAKPPLLEQIDGLLLPPPASDPASSDGARWVDQMNVGTDEERERMLVGEAGKELSEAYDIGEAQVAAFDPVAWAPELVERYARAAGVRLYDGLGRIEDHAEERLDGSRDGHIPGLRGASRQAVEDIASAPRGLGKAVAFAGGLSGRVQEVLDDISKSVPPNDDSELSRLEARLRRRVSLVTAVQPTVVLLIAIATTLLILASSVPAVADVQVAVPVGLVAGSLVAAVGGVAWWRRREAVISRGHLGEAIETRLASIAERHARQQQVQMVAALGRFVGEPMDARGRRTLRLEDAVRSAGERRTLVDELIDRYRQLLGLRQEVEQAWPDASAPGEPSADEDSRPDVDGLEVDDLPRDLGRFAVVVPDPQDREAVEALDKVTQGHMSQVVAANVAEQLERLTWETTPEELLASCESQAAELLRLATPRWTTLVGTLPDQVGGRLKELARPHAPVDPAYWAANHVPALQYWVMAGDAFGAMDVAGDDGSHVVGPAERAAVAITVVRDVEMHDEVEPTESRNEPHSNDGFDAGTVIGL